MKKIMKGFVISAFSILAAFSAQFVVAAVVDTITTNPTGGEVGFVVRNIPSGTQTVSGTISFPAGATITAHQGEPNTDAKAWPVRVTHVARVEGGPQGVSTSARIVSPSGEIINNKSALSTGRTVVTTSGTPVNLSSITIPFGKSIIIKALKTNSGQIRLADSSAEADVDLGANDSFSLFAQESVELLLTNANIIWIDATVNGEGITFVVEQ